MSYELRHHPRARRLKLRVERDGALVVTAPPRTARRTVDRFVESRRDWIDGVRHRLAAERAQRDPASSGPRPSRIELPAIGECWTLVYASDQPADRGRSEAGACRLTLCASDSDAEIAAALQAWTKRRARHALTPWIRSLADQYGLSFNRLSFRNQKSRWGSCSSRGNLSINARLLFAPPAVCRYVLVHELAHLKHPDHSPAFWHTVEAMAPGSRRLDRQLRAVGQQLPDWV
jgi:predicted metal-dependent hydrolase